MAQIDAELEKEMAKDHKHADASEEKSKKLFSKGAKGLTKAEGNMQKQVKTDEKKKQKSNVKAAK